MSPGVLNMKGTELNVPGQTSPGKLHGVEIIKQDIGSERETLAATGSAGQPFLLMVQYSLFPTSLGFPKCAILPLTLGMVQKSAQDQGQITQ